MIGHPHAQEPGATVVVTLCGSGRFYGQAFSLAASLEATGATVGVLCPPAHGAVARLAPGGDPELGELVWWKGALADLFDNVSRATIVCVVNPGGYVGPGTTLALGLAVAHKKLVVAMQPDAEPARRVLFDRVLGTDAPEVAAVGLRQLIAQATHQAPRFPVAGSPLPLPGREGGELRPPPPTPAT